MSERINTIIVLLSVCLFVSTSAAQYPGSVRGTVIDQTGAPVTGAQVMVDTFDERPKSKTLRVVETDHSGHFSVSDLELGVYKIFAMKEASGYPNTAFAFYSNHIFSTANLTANTPAIELVLKIGPPAGVIEGLVVDSSTNAPIDATFILRRAASPDNWVSIAQRSKYRILVPSATDITFEVVAPSYKTWYYGGPSDPQARSPLRLNSRDETTLNISLERDSELPKP